MPPFDPSPAPASDPPGESAGPPAATAGAAPALAIAGAGVPADAPGQSAADPEADAEAQRQARLQALRQRIQAQPDFASVKESMAGIQRISRSDRAHARALTNLIHDDPAMVAKLLRLINAAYYSSVGGGEITSIQRAIALMGFRPVGMLASSLLLMERLPQGADGAQLRREFARAQLAALIAHDLCHSRKHIEVIYIAALFQRLGDMLAGMHFADEAAVLDDQLDERGLPPGSAARHDAREQLARAHWGLTIDDIGLEMAAQWGWPASLLAQMRPLDSSDPERLLDGDEYARVLCTTANRLADELMRLPVQGNAEQRAEARAAFVQRYAADVAVPLGLALETLPERVERSHTAWHLLMQTLGVGAGAEGGAGPAASATSAAKGPKRPEPGTQAYRQRLAEDLADAVDHLGRLNRRQAAGTEVAEAAMQRLVKALDLQRAVLCLRDPASGELVGRLGVGDKAAVLAPRFRIPVAPAADLFGLLCLKNADTLISDTRDPIIAQRLPAWFTQRVKAGAFLVLPLVAGDQPLGLLYGDQAEPNRMQVNDRALTLLKGLRQQVLQALQAGAAGR